MIYPKRKFLKTCRRLLLAGIAAFAMPAPAAFAQAEKTPALVEFSFTVTAYRRPKKGVRFGVFDEAGAFQASQPITFRTTGRSPEYHYVGPNPVVFFRETPAPTPEDPKAVTYNAIGQTTVSPGIDRVLFVFFRDLEAARGEEKFLVFPMDDNWDDIPPGHISILNASGTALKGVAGPGDGREVAVAKGKNAPVPAAPSCAVRLAMLFRGNWQPVYQETFDCGEDERIVLILYPPSLAGSIHLRGSVLRDRLSAKEKADRADRAERAETP